PGSIHEQPVVIGNEHVLCLRTADDACDRNSVQDSNRWCGASMMATNGRAHAATMAGSACGMRLPKNLGRFVLLCVEDAMQRYTPFIGSTPAACQVTGPGYDVPRPADLGGPEADVPYVDAIAC